MNDKEFVSEYFERLWSYQSANRYGIGGKFYLDDYSVDEEGLLDRIFIIDMKDKRIPNKASFQYFDINDVASIIAEELRYKDKNKETIICGQSDSWGHMMCYLRYLKDNGYPTYAGSFEKMEAIKRKEAKQAVNEEPKQRNKQKMSI
ncbi:hypothetical protein RF542_27260 [Pseudomonas aeruginosa]